jgi:S-adenosylmethionine hydrolase
MTTLPPRRIITLTTDFGTVDHYAGAMKGVILSRCPGVEITDISHEIAPFSILAGAYAIDQVAPYFPQGTIHVVVVDPGVGTARKPLLVEALDQYFIAPDNGVLSLIVARDRNMKAREISNRDLWVDTISSTFHGRDLFAPVAAALASGRAAPDDVGPALADLVLLSDIEARQANHREWHGIVLSVDRFGNVITNFSRAAFANIASSPFSLHVGNGRITSFRATFGEAAKGECFAYFGSSGCVEVGMNLGSAAAQLQANPGDFVALKLLDLLQVAHLPT